MTGPHVYETLTVGLAMATGAAPNAIEVTFATTIVTGEIDAAGELTSNIPLPDAVKARLLQLWSQWQTSQNSPPPQP